jgi:uncharacterized protein (AIM24 family)
MSRCKQRDPKSHCTTRQWDRRERKLLEIVARQIKKESLVVFELTGRSTGSYVNITLDRTLQSKVMQLTLSTSRRNICASNNQGNNNMWHYGMAVTAFRWNLPPRT